MSLDAPSTRRYRKHFIPLESNPEVFTSLLHKLGVAPTVCFQDVLSLDDTELITFLPRPARALILVFPDTPAYQARIQKEDEEATEAEHEHIRFFKQTINNACGLYAILHAVCNSDARDAIQPQSILNQIETYVKTLEVEECALALENDSELEQAYAEVASLGDTAAPEDPAAEVDFHYICFVKSKDDGHLYQLDGMRKGPVRLHKMGGDEDVLSDGCLGVVREMVKRSEGNLNFSLMALVPAC